MLVAQRQAAQIVLGVRRVHRHDKELLELRRDDAAFLAVQSRLSFVGEREASSRIRSGKPLITSSGFVLGEDRRARVALLHGRVPILVIAGQIDFDLAALRFRFLQAEDVGLGALS